MIKHLRLFQIMLKFYTIKVCYLNSLEITVMLYYVRALKTVPDNFDVLFRKGILLARFGKHGDAIVCYDDALKIAPDNFDAMFQKGLVLEHLGNYKDAIKCFDKAIDKNPKHSEVLLHKGLDF